MNTELLEARYYKSITELPLNKYIDCAVDNDLNALIISGEPSPDQLLYAWQDIIQEYIDTCGDDEYTLYVLLLKEVGLLEIDISLVTNCVKILRMVYEQCFADQVNEILRTSFKFDWTDQEEYQNELNVCLVRLGCIEINLKVKKSNLSAMDEKFEGKGNKPTREYFQSVLITLSDHAKFNITDTITVYQFCDRIRRLNTYCEQLAKQR